MTRLSVLAKTLAASLFAVAAIVPAQAQNADVHKQLSSGTFNIISPFPAGGPVDTLARLLAEGLTKRYGQPAVVENAAGAAGNIGMDKVRQILTKFPVKTRVELTGTLIVARDAAHARIRKMLDEGKPMPQYFKDYPVYYAGPAKTPEGKPSGSFGPTTAGRMDAFVDQFQSLGGSRVMLAKGNRSKAVTDACKKHGGFYLGSIGGPAAILAQTNIRKVELVDFEDLGMEAVRKIDVVDFPAFIVVDDKGNDFFRQICA